MTQVIWFEHIKEEVIRAGACSQTAEVEVAANLEPGFDDNIQILTSEQCSGRMLELHPANAAVVAFDHYSGAAMLSIHRSQLSYVSQQP